MAEVGGLALAVVSLAMPLYQSLSTYVGHAKNAKEQVSHIQSQMNDLVDQLETLETVIGGVGPSASKQHMHAGIRACAKALVDIRKELAKREARSLGDSKVGQELIRLKNRLTFPLQKGDLMLWKGVVEDIQRNLQTAVTTLQLDYNSFTFLRATDVRIGTKVKKLIRKPRRLSRK
ncbi:hypothetical protein M011DRAFT_201978 [Sporormia fimetaria CBS 119925]|uniref:Fungal N-terminal domain-containing protein n=1 Tax=Sporormia fimetaria CBS 119925 TaxID=1340428 RepID=A0A6A6V326_9PLEO|nr:hypothetical protein M011DRAFT_201978 [Sporormia fimetaria CBS 119925]